MPFQLQRMTVSFCLASLLAACTHNPLTGEKAFKDFKQCLSTNSVGAVLGGVLVGTVISRAGHEKAGVMIGTSTAAAGIWLSWQRCAEVYQTVENTEIKAQSNDKKSVANKLTIEKLDVVAGKPGSDLRRVLRYTLSSADSAVQDVQVRETTVLQVAKVGNLPDKSVAFVDVDNKPILVAGKILRPGQKQIPADSLTYDDYALPLDITIRPGTRKSDGNLPTDSAMPADRPYRIKMIISGLNMQAEKTQSFTFSSK